MALGKYWRNIPPMLLLRASLPGASGEIEDAPRSPAAFSERAAAAPPVA